MAKYVLKRDTGSLPERITRYKSELNDEQFRVVTSPPKAALVVAGAGTGKTRAITYRVAYLIEQGVSPWSELPLWVPSTDPEHLGFTRVDCSRAAGAGLATRPLAETVDAVLDEFASLVDNDPRRRGQLTADRERELIARWRERAQARDAATTTP